MTAEPEVELEEDRVVTIFRRNVTPLALIPQPGSPAFASIFHPPAMKTAASASAIRKNTTLTPVAASLWRGAKAIVELIPM